MSPNFASWFWKSACWIRRISDPPPAAMTFSWTLQNGTAWIRTSSRKPWLKSSPRNETRKQSSRRFARRQTDPTHFPDLWRSANLHSAFCCLNGELPFWRGTPINYLLFVRHAF